MPNYCRLDDCKQAAHAKGMCVMHYTRWQRHGDPTVVKKSMAARARQGLDELTRFWRRVTVTDNGCWEWTGHLLRGYGRFIRQDGRTELAHRSAYALLVGEIPEGKQLDHLCFNRACVNPDHLEPVTNAENARRVAERNRREWDTCQAGRHPYPENRILEPSTGRYRCRECRREAQRRYKAKLKS